MKNFVFGALLFALLSTFAFANRLPDQGASGDGNMNPTCGNIAPGPYASDPLPVDACVLQGDIGSLGVDSHGYDRIGWGGNGTQDSGVVFIANYINGSVVWNPVQMLWDFGFVSDGSSVSFVDYYGTGWGIFTCSQGWTYSPCSSPDYSLFTLDVTSNIVNMGVYGNQEVDTLTFHGPPSDTAQLTLFTGCSAADPNGPFAGDYTCGSLEPYQAPPPTGQVPEPATLALVASGVLGGWLRRYTGRS